MADSKAAAPPVAEEEEASQSFEGPEKVFEVWFSPNPNITTVVKEDQKQHAVKRFGLRSIAREKWDTLLDLVKCKILSVVTNEHLDAYLLSESSMFVYPYKVVLKTCGTTTLLNCVEALLALGREVGLTIINNVFYSRKNFMDPSKQLYPHTSFDAECGVLDKIFRGAGYVLGQVNGDHWYLYMTDKKEGEDILSPTFRSLSNTSPTLTAKPAAAAPAPLALPSSTTADAKAVDEQKEAAPKPPSPSSSPAIIGTAPTPVQLKLSDLVPAPALKKALKKADQTLEVLMTGLDQEKMAVFYKKAGLTAKQVTKQSGIEALYPTAQIDEFLFDPCGYSMNGILERGYYTIHITPQAEFSYASFETNIPPTDSSEGDSKAPNYGALIHQVLEIFRPAKFTVTVFANDLSHEIFGISTKSAFLDIPPYKRSTKIAYEFENYKLSYCHYIKPAQVNIKDKHR